MYTRTREHARVSGFPCPPGLLQSLSTMELEAQSRGAQFPLARLPHPTGRFIYKKKKGPLERPYQTEELQLCYRPCPRYAFAQCLPPLETLRLVLAWMPGRFFFGVDRRPTVVLPAFFAAILHHFLLFIQTRNLLICTAWQGRLLSKQRRYQVTAIRTFPIPDH